MALNLYNTNYDEYKAVKSKIRQSEFLAYSYILFGQTKNMQTVAAKADEISFVSSEPFSILSTSAVAWA